MNVITISPSGQNISVGQSGTGGIVTLTESSVNLSTVTINQGQQGPAGPAGPAGVGGGSVDNYGDNRILTSDGTNTGINAENNLTFDGTTLAVSGALQVDKIRIDNYVIAANQQSSPGGIHILGVNTDRFIIDTASYADVRGLADVTIFGNNNPTLTITNEEDTNYGPEIKFGSAGPNNSLVIGSYYRNNTNAVENGLDVNVIDSTYRLDISSSGELRLNANPIRFGDGNQGYVYYSDGYVGAEMGLIDDVDNTIAVKNMEDSSYRYGGPNNSEFLVISSSGNVGIGNTNPSYKLDVNGSGNFASGLFVNDIPVSVSGHTHTSSDITDFNTSVSGLLPAINNSGDHRVLTSDGTSTGINAESHIKASGTDLVLGDVGLTDSPRLILYSSVDESALIIFKDSSGAQRFNIIRDDEDGENKIISYDPLLIMGGVGDQPVNIVSSGLLYNGTQVSVSGHAHTSSDITDFNTSVSGLIPVKDILAGSGISLSSISGIYTINATASGISGEFDKISFNTTADPTIETAEIGWNQAEGTLDLGLEGGVKIHIGEHSYFRIRNETANTIYAGQAVYASDVHNNILIEATPYTADGSIREIRFIGLVLSDVDTNQKGYAINFGHIENLDTRGNGAVNGAQNLYAADEPAWVEGDILYVHPTIPGKLTKIEPKHSISAAIVLYVHQNNGRIFVRPTSYGHLDDNHDVDLTGLSDDNLLVYNSSTENWEPSTDLTYNGETLKLIADGNNANFRINHFEENSVEPSRLVFRRGGGTQASQTIANSGDGIYAIRGESFDYNNNVTILGGLRMEIVDPASSTSLNPSTRIFLRSSSGGDNTLDNSTYLDPDGTLRNTGQIRGTNFYQPQTQANTFNGSLVVNDGLLAPTKIYALGNVSGNVSINYDIDKQIQTLTLDGTATNFIEGSDWPTSTSVDVLLEITVSSTTTVTWSIIDDWYNPVPSFVPGKYLVLLRSIGTTIQGHYIGEKTN